MGFWTKLVGGTAEEKTKTKNGKKVVTPKDLGVGLSATSLRAGNRLFQMFEDEGVVAQLSKEEQVRLALELLLFELLCKGLALTRFYGEEGHTASLFHVGAVLTTVAENSQVEDVSSFLGAAFAQLESHRQYYGQDIWDLLNLKSEEDAKKKPGLSLGFKILEKLLNPVLGVPLEKPAMNQEAGDDLQAVKRACEEAERRWERIPKRVELASHCFICAVTSLHSIKPFIDEFTLG